MVRVACANRKQAKRVRKVLEKMGVEEFSVYADGQTDVRVLTGSTNEIVSALKEARFTVHTAG